MEYNIPSKPTVYRGRLYRSRLEARWAAFFDITKWESEYEPMEINGRNPDFFLKVSSKSYPCSTIIVEIKPKDFLTQDFLDKALRDYFKYPAHLLFLTEQPFYTEDGFLCIGIGSQYYGKAEEYLRSEIHVLMMKCHNDFGSLWMNFAGMISGECRRKSFLSENTNPEETSKLIQNWGHAANEIMFLKPATNE